MVEMSLWAPITAIVVGLVATGWSRGLWRRLYIGIFTAPRDCQIIVRYIRALLYLWKCKHRGLSVADVFQTTVSRSPNKPCFVMDDTVWTFSEVDAYSNRVANAFVAKGYRRGDVVALMMENCLEYVPIWLGMAKVGIVSALINTNQRQKALLHSLKIAKCRALIYGATFKDAVAEILDTLPFPMTFYQVNDQQDTSLSVAENFGQLIEKQSTEFVGVRTQKSCSKDVLLYIYTSGTTGLPKAAIITNLRFLLSSGAFAILSKFRPDDVFYTPLPLYHSAGGNMTVGQALARGCTVVLRKKFSASQFFTDCRHHSCTAAQYIGEMCRYMLATKPSMADKDHRVRVMYGNGLRAQIWKEFVDRFNIGEVREFYASTEGNTNIINLDGKVGAIGYVPWLIAAFIPTTLIKADQCTGIPVRGTDGLCQKCGPNEPGLCIGKISNESSTEFRGYVDKASSSKKVIRDVFCKGDSAFVSGDILQFDDYGYYYFVDRTGDTFRWKGENVSTCEVEAIISNAVGLRDATAYGVVVGDAEGRAGMVAILDPEGTVNLERLCERLQKALPPYARPLFVRLLKHTDLTGTCKLRKVDLQKDGFDPSVVKDPIYYLYAGRSYERLTQEVFEKIVQNVIRF